MKFSAITVTLTLNTGIKSFRKAYDDVPSNYVWFQKDQLLLR